MNKRKRVLSLLLALALLLGGLPLTAFAEDGCAHVHDADCVYTESGDCNHVHDENCGLTTGQVSVTFDIPLNEFDEAWFFLTEGIPLTDADLLDGVTAVDENGGSVTVTVKDVGGLDMQNPVPKSAVFPNEPYIITYAAEHPVSGDEFTEPRELFITPGLGAITPTAGGTTTWNAAAPDISLWSGDNNVITVGAGASGTLIVPGGVTELTINGGTGAPVVINGSIYKSVGSSLTLNLNNVTINSDNVNGAVYITGSSALTLNVTGTVTLNGQTGDCRALSTYNLTIGGTGTLHVTGGNNTGGNGGDGIRLSGALTINSGCTVHATGGNGTIRGGTGISPMGGADNSGTVVAKGGDGIDGGDGGDGLSSPSSITNRAGGTITATGGRGGDSTISAGGDGGYGVTATGSITNNGTITGTGGRGGDSTSGRGGTGGTGVSALSSITNNAVGTITGTGGNGGDSTGGTGGEGGVGAYSYSNLLNSGEPSDFLVSGGAGGSGSPAGFNGAPLSGPVNSGSNGFSNPAIVFAPTTTVDLRNPTPLVFETHNLTLLTGQSFFGVGFDALATLPSFGLYLDGSHGVVYDDLSGTTGTLTIPAAAFGDHAQQSGNGALQPGNYIADIVFKTGANIKFSYYVPFTLTGASSGSSKSSGSGGYSPSTDDTWLERAPASTLATAAKSSGEDFAQTRRTGVYGVRGNAWDRLSGLQYQHDTLDGTAVQVRVTVPDPAKLTKDTRVSGYAKDPDAYGIKSRFEKRFKNNLRVIHFDHSGAWGQAVEIAAKIDLTGMDTKNLCFYFYDKATNKYKRIENPSYRIDKNGYLHFTTEFAGDIVISEGKLEKK